MRIRNSRNPIDVPATIHSGPSSAVRAPPSTAFPAAPELGVCVVNMSPWDVTPLVLAFFHADGLLQLHQQRCPSRDDNNDGDCHQKASAQEASALEEKHGQFTSGKGKQDGKRSKALFPNSERLAADPTTIPRSSQNSRRREAKKGGDEGSPATKGRGSTEAVKGRTCKREDGKGWRCSNEAAPGSTLCEHHLSQVRSYCKRPSNDSSKRRPPSMAEAGEGRRKRPIAQSSSTTTTSVGNDCYYYYYTGFGPAWRETKRKRVSAIAEDDGTDDDDDGGGGGSGGGGGTGADAAARGGRVNSEGDEDGGKGKIKGRKRVKCRSLKSLL